MRGKIVGVFDFVARWMSVFILVVTACAVLWPTFFTAVPMWMVSPLLGVIMFGMGLTLSPRDFYVLLKRPREVVVGCVAQFTVMPLVAWALTRMFRLPDDVAIGVILVGCCPGGTASNVITYLAGGDLALSVGITSCTTIMAPVMTPLLVWLTMGHTVNVDTLGMLLSIVYVIIAPIVAGLLFQRCMPRLTQRAVPLLPGFSSLSIALVVALVVSHAAEKLFVAGAMVVVVTVIHNALGLASGYALASLSGLSRPKRVAISVEVGMQNSGLASSLAVMHFAAYPMAAVPGAVFSVWHNISGSIIARWYKKRQKE